MFLWSHFPTHKRPSFKDLNHHHLFEMPTEVKTFGDILRDGAAALPSYLKPPVNGDGQLDPTHPTSQAVVQLVNTIRSSIDITEIKVARKWTRIGNSVFVFDENDSFLVDQCMVELDGHINLSALKVHDGTRVSCPFLRIPSHRSFPSFMLVLPCRNRCATSKTNLVASTKTFLSQMASGLHLNFVERWTHPSPRSQGTIPFSPTTNPLQ